MKAKKIVIILVVIMAIIGIIIMISSSSGEKKFQSRISRTCDDLTASLYKKEDVLLFVYPKESSIESIETSEKIKENYSETLVYIISYDDINNECIKKVLEKDNLYKDILNNPVPTVNLYKSGKFVGQMAGLDGYRDTEEYLIKNKMIEKEEIKDSISYEEYEKNIKQNDYLLLVIADEKMRKDLDELIKKNLNDYSYDIINMYTEEGTKIKLDIESNYDIVKEYPRMFYFKNGKLVISEDAFDEFTIIEYKKKIDKVNE